MHRGIVVALALLGGLPLLLGLVAVLLPDGLSGGGILASPGGRTPTPLALDEDHVWDHAPALAHLLTRAQEDGLAEEARPRSMRNIFAYLDERAVAAGGRGFRDAPFNDTVAWNGASYVVHHAPR